MSDTGISEKALAAATGIARSTLQRKLVEGDFTARQMAALATHFGLTVEELTGLAENHQEVA
jgi:plasmid maintenance system antidote protein VapI